MSEQPRELSCAVAVAGRVLVSAPGDSDWLVVGLHGYGETAAVQFDRQAAAIPTGGAHAAAEALHAFYPRGALGASWLTSDRRELRLAENIVYLEQVLDSIRGSGVQWKRLAWLGFSQGASQAYRAAQAIGGDGLCVLGGDIPPEFDQQELHQLPPLLIGRGDADAAYSAETFQHDQDRLSAAGVQPMRWTDSSGHQWTDEWNGAVQQFLQAL